MTLPLTKKAINELKRYEIQHTIACALHILHESYMYGTKIWPKRGFRGGWTDFRTRDIINVGARVDYDSEPQWMRRLIINTTSPTPRRMYDQMEAIELVLSDAVYDGVLFRFNRSSWMHTSDVGKHGQLTFTFEKTN